MFYACDERISEVGQHERRKAETLGRSLHLVNLGTLGDR